MALFTNTDSDFIIEVDFRNGFKERLAKWLEEEQNDVFWDIEFHEGGSVSIELGEPTTITFSGDNGIFQLELVEVQKV